ncbi:hypothetical protein ACSQ67_021039 [Phaseolus vulgaris]
MSWRKMGIWGPVNCLLGNAGPFGSRDWVYNSRLYKSQLPHAFHKSFADESMVYPPGCSSPYKGYRDVDWQDNDGALNTISMTHLLLPIEHPNCLVEKESDCKPLYPGIRYYKYVEWR